MENLLLNLNSSKSILAINREFLATRMEKKEKDEFDLEDEDDPVESKFPPGAVQFLLDEKSLEKLDAAVREVESWLTEKIAAQEKLEDWEEPVLHLSDIERKNNHLQSVLKKIIHDQAKATAKTKSSSATATVKPSASASADAEGYGADDEKQTDATTETVTSTIIEDMDAEETSKTNRKHEEL